MKKLPICFNNIPFSALFYSYGLSILYSIPQLLPWIYENYIYSFTSYGYYNNDIMNISGYIDFFSYNDFAINKNILEIQNIPNQLMQNIDIIKFILDNLNLNKYVLLYLNEYYLSECSVYQQEHFLHEQLFYGYDDYHFFSVAVSKQGHYEEIKHTYNDIILSFKNSFNIDILQNAGTFASENSAVLLRLNENIIFNKSYPFSIERFENKLNNYIIGDKIPELSYFLEYKKWDMKYFYNKNYYDILDYCGNDLDVLFRIIHHDYEYSIEMQKKLEYIAYKYKTQKYILATIEHKEKVVNALSIIRNKILKQKILSKDFNFDEYNNIKLKLNNIINNRILVYSNCNSK